MSDTQKVLHGLKILQSGKPTDIKGRIYTKEFLIDLEDAINSSVIVYGTPNIWDESLKKDLDMDNVSHEVHNAEIQGDKLFADVHVLDNDQGDVLLEKLEDSPRFRPRIVGRDRVEDGKNVVFELYELKSISLSLQEDYDG